MMAAVVGRRGIDFVFGVDIDEACFLTARLRVVLAFRWSYLHTTLGPPAEGHASSPMVVPADDTYQLNVLLACRWSCFQYTRLRIMRWYRWS